MSHYDEQREVARCDRNMPPKGPEPTLFDVRTSIPRPFDPFLRAEMLSKPKGPENTKVKGVNFGNVLLAVSIFLIAVTCFNIGLIIGGKV